MLFVRLTLQTTFSLCQFDGDTETEYVDLAFEALKSEALQSAPFSCFIAVLTQLQESDASFEACSTMKRPACFKDDLGSRLTVVFLCSDGVAEG